MESLPTLIAGEWHTSESSFSSYNPATGEELAGVPISNWDDVDKALDAGSRDYPALRDEQPSQIAGFLRRYADRIEARADEIVSAAASETALAPSPRLIDVELPRTTDQLRQAARAAEERSWLHPTLSPSDGVASMFAPIPGVVCVLGPNNFPFAFNGISGGDFAAAIATHHPVIAVANPGHPITSWLLAEEATAAVADSGLPPASVQLVYRMENDSGLRMVADCRTAASAFTGSRRAGMTLKAAADTAGKPIYLEMSSVNPVVVLPGAAAERPRDLATELTQSLLLGSGQFCTKPGLIFVVRDAASDTLTGWMRKLIEESFPATLLTAGVRNGLQKTQGSWRQAGAEPIAHSRAAGVGTWFPNSLMAVNGSTFLANRETLEAEAFGNLGLVVETDSIDQLTEAVRSLEGNLTGTIYSAVNGSDSDGYKTVEPVLRERVGRLINDKAPTGVAVTAAMNHGGPYPAAGHPGFTSVGIPNSLRRFAMLRSYDNVADLRLPPALQAANPLGLQRYVDGEWTRQSIEWQ